MGSVKDLRVFQDSTQMRKNKEAKSKLTDPLDCFREKCTIPLIDKLEPSNSTEDEQICIKHQGKQKKPERKVTFGPIQVGFFNRNGYVSDQRVVSFVSTKADLQYVIRKHQLDEIYGTIHDLERNLVSLSGQAWKNSLREINRLNELAEILENSLYHVDDDDVIAFDS